MTTRLQIKINEKFGILIPVMFFYNNPTIGQIVDHIKDLTNKPENHSKKEGLVIEIGSILNLDENEYIILQDNRAYILFIADIKFQTRKEEYMLRLKENISEKMLLYIFQKSLYKEEYNCQNKDYNVEDIAEIILKENAKNDNFYEIIKYIYKDLDEYTCNILYNNVDKI